MWLCCTRLLKLRRNTCPRLPKTRPPIALGKVMMTEVKDKADADRLAQLMVNPSSASITDACWVMKASIRSIDRLPQDQKEIVLAGTSL